MCSAPRFWLPLAALLGLGLAAPYRAQATVYKWTDKNGVSHYTMDREEIPVYLRTTLRPAATQPERVNPVARTPLIPEAGAAVPAGSLPRVGTAPAGLMPEDPEIQALARRISQDRELIKALISEPGVTGMGLAEDPRLREIVDRLPEMQSELAARRAPSAR